MDRSLPTQDVVRMKQLLFFDWCIAIEHAPDLDPHYYLSVEKLLDPK